MDTQIKAVSAGQTHTHVCGNTNAINMRTGHTPPRTITRGGTGLLTPKRSDLLPWYYPENQHCSCDHVSLHPARKVGLAKSGRNQNRLKSARKTETGCRQREGAIQRLTCVRKVPERGAERGAFQTLPHRAVVVKTGPSQDAVHNVALGAHASSHHTSAQQTGPHHTFLLFQLRCTWKTRQYYV